MGHYVEFFHQIDKVKKMMNFLTDYYLKKNFQHFDKKMKVLGQLVDIYNRELGYEQIQSKQLLALNITDIKCHLFGKQ